MGAGGRGRCLDAFRSVQNQAKDTLLPSGMQIITCRAPQIAALPASLRRHLCTLLIHTQIRVVWENSKAMVERSIFTLEPPEKTQNLTQRHKSLSRTSGTQRFAMCFLFKIICCKLRVFVMHCVVALLRTFFSALILRFLGSSAIETAAFSRRKRSADAVCAVAHSLTPSLFSPSQKYRYSLRPETDGSARCFFVFQCCR